MRLTTKARAISLAALVYAIPTVLAHCHCPYKIQDFFEVINTDDGPRTYARKPALWDEHPQKCCKVELDIAWMLVVTNWPGEQQRRMDNSHDSEPPKAWYQAFSMPWF